MPRMPQPHTPAQERNQRRRQVLARMDVAELRTWLETEGFGALGDDSTILQAAHEARLLDTATPGWLRRESVRWLREHAPQSDALLSDRERVKRMQGRWDA